MATQATVRQINGAAALSALWTEGPMTKAELARRLGLTKSTVTSITAQLEKNGLLSAGTKVGPGKIGRPGTFMEIRPEGSYFLGIEVGVDRMHAITMDLGGGIRDRLEQHGQFWRQPIPAVLDAFLDLYKALKARLGADAKYIRDVRVAVPRYVMDEGELINAQVVGWGGIPLGRILTEAFGVDVKVENDANAAAFAEWYLREDLRNASMFLLLLEAGVGGGCITGGELVTGSHGLAGEIGHTRFMLSGGPGTPFRLSESLENIIGKKALIAGLRENGIFCEDAAAILAKMDDGNVPTNQVVQNWARSLGAAAAFVALAHDVENIVLGGELAALFPYVETVVASELASILPPGFPPPNLRKAQFIVDGGAVGAAALGHAAALKG